ncbi:cilia- and flagella-associated protein 58 isoform X1 [Denticeps clupeoides]|uniref:Cilia- and flagella-associated protein 58 central coiled coil domain-containing protein n=1 Tax=Denticeps clupeoides TaxID=299321 RepID=A0AAY4EZ95_9TELE|nr:cilia- and flagella-associated protein 58 isoform X1 [Denticeps clupeoides]
MEEKGQDVEAKEGISVKEFQDVLNELGGEKIQERFPAEYEKVTKALKKSHENEKRLMAKCRELSAEITSYSVKVTAAMKLTQEDQGTITTMKKELEKAWKIVDAAREKELQNKETIQSLKQEIVTLTEQSRGASTKHNVDELLKVNTELKKEHEEMLKELANQRQNLSKSITGQQDLEAWKEDAVQTISKLQQEVQVHQNECSRETRQRERLDKKVMQLQAALDTSQADIRMLTQQNQHSQDEQQRLEQQLREQKVMFERTTKELEQQQQRNSKLQQENEQNTTSLEQLSLDNQQKSSHLKIKEEECSHMRQEISKLSKVREATQRKLHQTEDQKVELEQQRDTLKSQMTGMEREMELSKRQMESLKKSIDDLVRERDLLNQNLIKASSTTEKQISIVKIHEQTKKNLDQEISNYRNEAQKQRNIIFQLEKERDRYINQASNLTHKVLQHMEDIKVKEMQIFDYRKKLAEAETNLKQQQNLYEVVRADRNLYSKNHIESQSEIAEMRKKLKIAAQQMEQLKEESSVKEVALLKEQQEIHKMEKEKDCMKTDLQKLKQQIQEMKLVIENKEAEEKKLLKIIADADADNLQQKKALDQVISNRNLLGTVLVRRNDELALLYEKIDIQQALLNKGEQQYERRVEDIRLLKLEIKNLRREKIILTKTASNIEELRREVCHMQRELVKERNRCRALEEEVQNPLNVHRWRELEARDPGSYELIQKIHSLQKRLIAKSDEVVEKELLLQEKDTLYVELKHILARQPGLEAAEQLQIYQQTIRERTKQLKVLTSELNMFESLKQQDKYEIERLTSELQNVKKKYLSLKRKEQQAKEKERTLAQVGVPVIQPQWADGPRFTGGGFNLKQSSRVPA